MGLYDRNHAMKAVRRKVVQAVQKKPEEELTEEERIIAARAKEIRNAAAALRWVCCWACVVQPKLRGAGEGRKDALCGGRLVCEATSQVHLHSPQNPNHLQQANLCPLCTAALSIQPTKEQLAEEAKGVGRSYARAQALPEGLWEELKDKYRWGGRIFCVCPKHGRQLCESSSCMCWALTVCGCAQQHVAAVPCCGVLWRAGRTSFRSSLAGVAPLPP